MTQYLLKRILLLVPTLWGVSLLSFLCIHLAPGGPIEQRLQRLLAIEADAAAISAQYDSLHRHYGYDRPLFHSYLDWSSKLLRFDFGESELFKQPVFDVLSRRAAVSWSYAAIALPCCYLLALWVSVLGLRSFRASQLSNALAALLFSTPPIVVALALKYAFVSQQGLLIVACYVLVHFSMMIFLFKGSMEAEEKQVYVQVARAKGLSSTQVLIRHVLRNALLPIVTSISYSILAFFSGSLFIETVFEIDGLGLVAYRAFLARDYNLIMGIVFGLSGVFLVSRLLTDFLYGLVDPRVRLR